MSSAIAEAGASRPRSKDPGLAIGAVVLCALVALLDGFDTQMIGFVAPLISREWSVELAAFGR
jgi:MFS transporter, AAHS family, 4-hydroxybenzoate transporter